MEGCTFLYDSIIKMYVMSDTAEHRIYTGCIKPTAWHTSLKHGSPAVLPEQCSFAWVLLIHARYEQSLWPRALELAFANTCSEPGVAMNVLAPPTAP
jgi:hypothetical protein